MKRKHSLTLFLLIFSTLVIAQSTRIWHVKAIHPDGYILDVKALDKDGNKYDVKCLQENNNFQLMDIKALMKDLNEVAANASNE